MAEKTKNQLSIINMLFLVVLSLALLERIVGHATFMLQQGYCTQAASDKWLQLNTNAHPIQIMSIEPILDTLGRNMVVTRNGVPLVSGSSYYQPGESLSVTVDQFQLEVVFQAEGRVTLALLLIYISPILTINE